MKKTTYVAETDEDGAIVCVWVAADGQRATRPFDPRRHRFHPDEKANFHGARASAIGSWMAAHQINAEQ